MASTPPPPERIHTPPTPLHGPQYDTWEPYSPRRTTRAGKRAHITSSPNTTSTKDGVTSSSPPVIAPTPKSRKRVLSRQISSQTLSPPSSPEASHRRTDNDQMVNLDVPIIHSAEDQFPTPRKTPRRQDHTSRNSTARILHFRAQPDELLPTPRKRRVRASLDSPQTSPPSAEVQIYTDSQDRVPEMEPAEDNPFVGPRKTDSGRGSSSKSKRMTREEAMMDEAVKNDEGIIFTFRGRKVLKRYSDAPLDEAELHSMAGQSARLRHQAGASANRPITRSALKPRLLFPTAEVKTPAEQEDEEAVTDIEDEAAQRSRECNGTELRFASVEPEESLQIEPAGASASFASTASFTSSQEKAKKASPFDSWPRQKPGSRGATHGTKRAAAEPTASTSAKRTRSSAHSG